jgi:MFS family permease
MSTSHPSLSLFFLVNMPSFAFLTGKSRTNVLRFDSMDNPITPVNAEKQPSTTVSDNSIVSQSCIDGDKPTVTGAQPGVESVEAITLTWSKQSLIVAYVMIWVIYFVQMLQAGTTGTLLPYVTSSFGAHSLTPTVSIFSSIIGAVLQLSLAKVLDVWGRPQGLLMSVVVGTLGIVMMAACNTVEMYAAAQVFFTLGNNCVQYCLSVFIADTSSLANRGFLIALTSSANLITTWLAGPISEALLDGIGWRWGFGIFSIVLPGATVPLYGLFMYNLKKSRNQGLAPRREESRTIWQSVTHYWHQFDGVGILLLSVGLTLFLLPFNIYSLQSDGWRAPLVICLLVAGIVLIVAFAVWERFFAPVTFFPYSLLSNRTVLGAYALGATLFTSYYCWDSYFSSFLQVVNDVSVTDASYVSQTYNVGSCLWGIVTGLIIRRTGRYKPVTLYFGVPVSILGLGLMIHFRQPDSSVGYIVMCQTLMALAGGTIIISDGVATMSAASHQHVAVVLAVDSMFSQIGGAVGLTMAATIWQGVFPAQLARHLPASEQSNLLAIYEDLATQVSYPVGSAARSAIQMAYADAQRMLLIAATSVWAVGLVAVLFWRDTDVREIEQVRGHIF